MVRVRPIGTTAIVCLKLSIPIAGLAIIRGGDASAGLAAGLSARTDRRHRAAQSMRCARPSDLHPHGRIAGFPARMRATPPAGSGGDGHRGMPLSAAGSPVFRVEAGTAGTCERGDGGATAGRGPS